MTRTMKDSGIEWIGEIPENWDIERLARHLMEINEKNFPIKTTNVLSLTNKLGVIPYEDKGNQGNKAKENYEEYKVAYKDTIIANSMNILIGSVGYSNYYGCVSPVYYVFKEKPKNNLYFLNYIMQTPQFQKELRKYANGILEIRLRLSANDILKRIVAFPPLSEQDKIAAFLDEKCGAIDEIISKTEQSIEEYKKLKQSVITKAVTKGIRSNRPMQDSNIEWIGEIPTDWEIMKLKFVFEIKKDIAGKEGYTVLSITQTGIKPKNITSNEGQQASDYSKYQLVDKGDFAMNHMDLLTGWVDISKYDGVTSPDYRVFRLKKINNCDRYFLYMMQLCYLNKIFYGFGQGVSGFGRWRLPADMFLNFLIPIPPLDEQKEIADYLDEKCAEIDTLIEKKQQFLAEMANYKKSLIYEYVTGKKEVA